MVSMSQDEPLHVITGPMCSEKTTKLIDSMIYRAKHNIPALLITHPFIHCGPNRVVSRTNRIVSKANGSCKEVSEDDLMKVHSLVEYHDSKAILIDEAQLFDGLLRFVEYALCDNKEVFVFGDDTSLYGELNALLPFADNAVKCMGVCDQCSHKSIRATCEYIHPTEYRV